MSNIKDNSLPIMLDKERRLYYSLNAVDQIQDKVGDISNLKDVMAGPDTIKKLIWLITIGVNEGAALAQFLATGSTNEAEVLDERTVGLLINTGNMKSIQEAFFKAFAAGMKGAEMTPDEADGENDGKNLKAGKSK